MSLRRCSELLRCCAPELTCERSDAYASPDKQIVSYGQSSALLGQSPDQVVQTSQGDGLLKGAKTFGNVLAKSLDEGVKLEATLAIASIRLSILLIAQTQHLVVFQ